MIGWQCISGSLGGAWVDRVDVHGKTEWTCMGGLLWGAWADGVEVHGWMGRSG